MWTTIILSALIFASSVVPEVHALEGRTVPKIVVVVPTTGPYAALGRQLAEAARLAAQELSVEIEVCDTQADAGVAVKCHEKAAKDERVIAMLGPVGQREARAVDAAADRVQLPVFVLASTDLGRTQSAWVVRLRPSVAEQAQALARFARKTLGVARVAVAFPRTEYGQTATRAFIDAFIKVGGRVTGLASYGSQTTDFRNPLRELGGLRVWVGRHAAGKSASQWQRPNSEGYWEVKPPEPGKPRVDFEALFIPDTSTQVARLLPFVFDLDFLPSGRNKSPPFQLLGLSAWKGRAMQNVGSLIADSIITETCWEGSAESPEDEFHRLFESQTGRRPTAIEAQVFDAVQMIARMGSRSQVSAGVGNVQAQRLALLSGLPRKRAWRGVCGNWQFDSANNPVGLIDFLEYTANATLKPRE